VRRRGRDLPAAPAQQPHRVVPRTHQPVEPPRQTSGAQPRPMGGRGRPAAAAARGVRRGRLPGRQPTGHRLCGEHFGPWWAERPDPADVGEQAVRVWAAGQSERLQINQFDMSGLAATLRWELLYVLQQRDNQGQRLDPAAVRQLACALGDVPSVASILYSEVERRLGRTPIVHSYARFLVRVIGLAVEAYHGVAHTDRDVWQALALDLQTPRPGRRPNRALIDFTPISQPYRPARRVLPAPVADDRARGGQRGRDRQSNPRDRDRPTRRAPGPARHRPHLRPRLDPTGDLRVVPDRLPGPARHRPPPR
jgi:hypothetical protein